MGSPVCERPLDVLTYAAWFHLRSHEQEQVYQILDARIIASNARQGAGVKLLGELLFTGDHAEFRARKAGEVEPALSPDSICRFDQVIADADVNMESNKRTPRHAGLNGESAPALRRGIQVQNRLANLENETIAQIEG